MMKKQPIGVMDAGIGGLTVVREIQKLYPSEDILYFGDSANNPYGLKSEEEIVRLSKAVISYLGENGAKAVAIACNTISAAIEQLQDFPFPVLGIIEPAAKAVAALKLKEVGVFATPFTTKSGNYPRLINAYDPDVKVYSQGSPFLGPTIDKGDFENPAIAEEIKGTLGKLLAEKPLADIVLGCTHFPFAMETLYSLYPDVNFIDPAREQAKQVHECLAEKGQVCEEGEGKLTIVASKNPEVYEHAAKKLGLQRYEIKFHVL